MAGSERLAAEVQIQFCGRDVRLPLRIGEGLTQLKARVAKQLSIEEPFDISRPGDAPLRSDDDVAKVARDAEAGSAPSLRVDADETHLVRIHKRACEESEAHWEVVRQVVRNLKKDIIEIKSDVANLRREASDLEDKLCNEKTERVEGDASVRKYAIEETTRIDGDLAAQKHDSRSGLDQAVEKLRAELGEISSKLDAEIIQRAAEDGRLEGLVDDRNRAATAALESSVEELRRSLSEEARTRGADLHSAFASIRKLEEELGAEREQRLGLEKVAKAQKEEADAGFAKESGLRKNDKSATDAALAELRAALQAESEARGALADEVASHHQHHVGAADAAASARVSGEAGVLSRLGSVETALQEALAEERVQRERGNSAQEEALRKVAAELSEEAEQRRRGEERSTELIGEAKEELSREVAARKSADAEHQKKRDLLADKAASENAARESSEASLKDGIGSLRHELDEEKRQRIAQDQKLHDLHEELRESQRSEEDMRKSHAEEQREWIRLLLERAAADERATRTSAHDKLAEALETKLTALTNRMKDECVSEISRLEEARRTFEDHHGQCRREDQLAAEEHARTHASRVEEQVHEPRRLLRDLEHQHQILKDRVEGGLSAENSGRGHLERRVSDCELDLRKIRGHLPILFASPGSFGAGGGNIF